MKTFRSADFSALLFIGLLAISLLLMGENPASLASQDGQITVKNAQGQYVAVLTPQRSAYNVHEFSNHLPSKVRIQNHTVRLHQSDPQIPKGTSHWKIIPTESGAKINNDEQELAYRIRYRSNGDWQLKDNHKNLLLHFVKRSHGYNLRDAKNKLIAQIVPQSYKVVIFDAAGNERYSVRGTDNVQAAMWFAAEEFLTDERSALFTFFEHLES